MNTVPSRPELPALAAALLTARADDRLAALAGGQRDFLTLAYSPTPNRPARDLTGLLDHLERDGMLRPATPAESGRLILALYAALNPSPYPGPGAALTSLLADLHDTAAAAGLNWAAILGRAQCIAESDSQEAAATARLEEIPDVG